MGATCQPRSCRGCSNAGEKRSRPALRSWKAPAGLPSMRVCEGTWGVTYAQGQASVASSGRICALCELPSSTASASYRRHASESMERRTRPKPARPSINLWECSDGTIPSKRRHTRGRHDSKSLRAPRCICCRRTGTKKRVECPTFSRRCPTTKNCCSKSASCEVEKATWCPRSDSNQHFREET
jgi:hypothetical protein